jgi:exopolysaccharide production protein ExoZ
MSMGHFSSIQQLRGFAALAVVLFHFIQGSGWSWDVGAAGVDVFFVISGFVMWMVTRHPTTSRDFISSRIIRIVPLYWLATAIISVKNHPPLADIARSLLFIPFDSQVGRYPVLIPGWTLNMEMFFYTIFALGLFVPRRVQLPFLGTVLLGLTGLGYAFAPSGPVLGTYTHPLLLEFLAGVLLCEACLRGWVKDARGWVLVVLGLAWFAGVETLGPKVDGLDLRPLLWGAPALLIVCGFVAMERAGKRVTIPVFERLGDASYSLYLFHGIVLSVLLKLLPESPLIFVVGVPASLVVGWLAYRFAELPMLAAMKRWIGRRRRSDTSASVGRPRPAMPPS